ncbi:MAG: TIM barrel protein [Sediminibacterium sp.]
MSNALNRRKLLKQVLSGSAAIATGLVLPQQANAQIEKLTSHLTEDNKLKGNIHHSVCRWCYSDLSLDDLCKEVKRIGFNAIDLLKPNEWSTVKKYGIECSMCYTGGETSLTKGWNNPANHPWLIKDYLEAIPLVAEAGYKNSICFAGNRNGMDDATGLQNWVDGLKQIMPLAEAKGVTIQIELFNSKVDHKDYMGDKSAWGIELCKKLGSPNFKILFDIYHMQIDEGDIIRSIQDNHFYFGHYHTAGVPGRHELDDRQELNYPAIMRAIKATGYNGFVAHEFIATNPDKISSLQQAVTVCDI